MQVGLRNLDVVAEHLVVANLERCDSGALPLALFHRGDNLPALLRDIAQFVELGVITAPDHSGIIRHRRRIVRNSARNHIAHIGQLIHLLADRHEPRGGISIRSARPYPRRATRTRGIFSSDARSASKSRGVTMPSVTRLVNRSRSRIPSSSLANLLARDGPGLQFRHRLEPRFDFLDHDLRPQHPAPQQPRAHSGRRFINRRQKRRRASSPAEAPPAQGSAPSPDREPSRPAARSRRFDRGARAPFLPDAVDGTTAASSGFRAPIAEVSRR